MGKDSSVVTGILQYCEINFRKKICKNTLKSKVASTSNDTMLYFVANAVDSFKLISRDKIRLRNIRLLSIQLTIESRSTTIKLLL